MFFQGRDEVHKTLRRVVKRLERAGISYAALGGMAVNAHGYRRTTGDVDLLLTPEGLEEFRKKFVPKNYEQGSSGFRCKTTEIPVFWFLEHFGLKMKETAIFPNETAFLPQIFAPKTGRAAGF